MKVKEKENDREKKRTSKPVEPESPILLTTLPHDSIRWMNRRKKIDSQGRVPLTHFRERQLREIFEGLDLDHQGEISIQKIEDAAKYIQSHSRIKSRIWDNIGNLFRSMDDDLSGTIDYREFTAGMAGGQNCALEGYSEQDIERLHDEFVEYAKMQKRQLAISCILKNQRKEPGDKDRHRTRKKKTHQDSHPYSPANSLQSSTHPLRHLSPTEKSTTSKDDSSSRSTPVDEVPSDLEKYKNFRVLVGLGPSTGKKEQQLQLQLQQQLQQQIQPQPPPSDPLPRGRVLSIEIPEYSSNNTARSEPRKPSPSTSPKRISSPSPSRISASLSTRPGMFLNNLKNSSNSISSPLKRDRNMLQNELKIEELMDNFLHDVFKLKHRSHPDGLSESDKEYLQVCERMKDQRLQTYKALIRDPEAKLTRDRVLEEQKYHDLMHREQNKWLRDSRLRQAELQHRIDQFDAQETAYLNSYAGVLGGVGLKMHIPSGGGGGGFTNGKSLVNLKEPESTKDDLIAHLIANQTYQEIKSERMKKREMFNKFAKGFTALPSPNLQRVSPRHKEISINFLNSDSSSGGIFSQNSSILQYKMDSPKSYDS